ncbi:hypothetical protein ACHAW5_011270 [Stephanodiscus triporus]|uniref:Fe2OG dioxygenase domain-containing protein n=1 Tax=Stephanodiscus triporus TaxID=2934178 RepID=A0ABD3MGV0_9STRA
MEGAMDAARRFFRLDLETKMRVRRRKMRDECDDRDNDDDGGGGKGGGGGYQAELIELSDKLLLALGRSLNHDPNGPSGGGGAAVAEDYFVSRSRKPMCTLRLLHYPPVDDCDGGDGGASGSLGCGAHTDYGLFTILQQDSIGGLQVRNRGGRWIDAKPLKGSFVINVGDMLSRWTNSEYASTVHRVVSRGGDRYSVPFFFNPDFDAVVKPLRKEGLEESERGPDDDGDGGGQTALEILKDRYNGTFTKIEMKS